MARKLDQSAKMLFIGEVIADMLRAAEPELAALVDLDSIEALPTEYIDGDTRTRRFGDAAFRVKFRKGRFPAHGSKGAKRRRRFLIVAVELQHTNDTDMLDRVREYADWQEGHYRQQGVVREGEHPPLLALVIHTGPDRWTAADGTEVFEGLPRGAARRLARWQRQAYIPIKAGRRSTLSLPEDNRLGAVVRLARCPTRTEMIRQLALELEYFGGPEHLRFQRGLLARVEEVWGDVGVEMPSVEELLEAKEEGRMADFLEVRIREWRDEAIAEGRAIGIEAGREEGREEGQRVALERLAADRFGPEAARRLSDTLNGTPSSDRVVELGNLIFRSRTAEEFVDGLDS